MRCFAFILFTATSKENYENKTKHIMTPFSLLLIVTIWSAHSWRTWYGGMQFGEVQVEGDDNKFDQILKDPSGTITILKRRIDKTVDNHHRTPWIQNGNHLRHKVGYQYVHMNGAFFVETDPDGNNKFAQLIVHINDKKNPVTITPVILTKESKRGRDFAKKWADIDNWNLYISNGGRLYYEPQYYVSGLCPMKAINNLFQGPDFNANQLEAISQRLGHKPTFWDDPVVYAAKKITGGAWTDDVLLEAMKPYHFKQQGFSIRFNKNNAKARLDGIKNWKRDIVGIYIIVDGHIFALKQVNGRWYNLDGLPDGFTSKKNIWENLVGRGNPTGMTWDDFMDDFPVNNHWKDKFEEAIVVVRDPNYPPVHNGISPFYVTIISAAVIIIGFCVCCLLLGVVGGALVAKYTYHKECLRKKEQSG